MRTDVQLSHGPAGRCLRFHRALLASDAPGPAWGIFCFCAMSAATDIDTTSTTTAKHFSDLLLSVVFHAAPADYVLRALRDARPEAWARARRSAIQNMWRATRSPCRRSRLRPSICQRAAMHEPASPARHVRFGAFELNIGSGELYKGRTRLRVPDQSIEILKALLEHPGELVTREALRDRLWSSDTFVDFERRAERRGPAPARGARRLRGRAEIHRDAAPSWLQVHRHD